MTAPRLGRDITVVLVLKVAVLSALYLMFFRGDERPTVDARLAARHLLSPDVPRRPTSASSSFRACSSRSPRSIISCSCR